MQRIVWEEAPVVFTATQPLIGVHVAKLRGLDVISSAGGLPLLYTAYMVK
jgi:hypothetical protein